MECQVFDQMTMLLRLEFGKFYEDDYNVTY